jgi:hypothetical protein
MYLPLDKLMQQSGVSGLTESEASQRTPDAALPLDPGPRSRDSLRNRERGER